MNIIVKIKQKILSKYVETDWYKHLIDSNPRKALDIYYYLVFGTHINWENPQTLNEKIMWLSVYSDTTLWSKYTDKYDVRDYVMKLGYGDSLAKLYGVWDDVNQIDYDSLPNCFVIKCTHDSHSTFLIKDKTIINREELNKELSSHLNVLYGYRYCEPHYNSIKPRIIAEELLLQKDKSFSTSMIDYKFFCINSQVKYCLVCYDRLSTNEKTNVKKEIYNVNPWVPNHNAMSKLYNNQTFDKQVPEPPKLKVMIDMAEHLSNGFPFVRVDLYNDNGRIYFSELTFTPAGGCMICFSEAVQLELGKQLSL